MKIALADFMSRFPGAGVVGAVGLRDGKRRLLLPLGCSVERRNRSCEYDDVEKSDMGSPDVPRTVRGIAHCDGEYPTGDFNVNASR